MDYELVAGVETHVQLKTRTKLFCGCEVKFGAPPNTLICPVCLGLPGALPVLNRRAFDLGLRAALALNCRIAEFTKFDRKNYFYPDLPKNYQISQYDLPFSRDGFLEIEVKETVRRIGIIRVHLEEDAGKLIHEEGGGHSLIDLNRCGIPLIEIVTHPDFRSADEVHAYLTELKVLLQCIDVSDCDMEKGELRCDVNLSVRPKGSDELGVRTETKNLNSFRFVKQAVEYEFHRHVDVLKSGGRIFQETRLYDEGSGVTRPMRSKEEAHDYRYFPEPDLLPVRVSTEWLEDVRRSIPELPAARRERLVAQYGISSYDSRVLTAERSLADFFESAAKLSIHPKSVANWILNDLMRIVNEKNLSIATIKATPTALIRLIDFVEKKTVTGSTAKDVLLEMVETGRDPSEIVQSKGLSQVIDTEAIDRWAAEAIAAHPKAVEDYKAGKPTALKFFIGQIMKASKGRANPKLAEEALKRSL